MSCKLKSVRNSLLSAVRSVEDDSGNIMWITALAMFPLLALVGSGVDMSRYYAAKTRLQQSCDAGILAARQQMKSVSNPYSTSLASSIVQAGEDTFNFNFPEGVYGSKSRSFSISVPAGTPADTAPTSLNGAAATTMRPFIMSMFGFSETDLTANCSSRYESGTNVDVVLVLDVTGSMEDPVSKTDRTKKITALKTAVKNFVDTLVDGQTGGARVRIGYVPYSWNTNVGKLIPTKYFATRWAYTTGWDSYRNRPTLDDKTDVQTYLTQSVSSYTPSRWDGCVQEVATKAVVDPAMEFTVPSDLDPEYVPPTDVRRDISGTIDLTHEVKKWKPNWRVNGNSTYYTCPPAAQLLTTYPKDNSALKNALKTKIDALFTTGGTYHDVGMMWGMRLLAPVGLFETPNADPPDNGLPVRRHLIFMTDGMLTEYTSQGAVSNYGYERYEKRVGYPQLSRMRNRFNFLCDQIKTARAGEQSEPELWVLAFGSEVSVKGTSDDAVALRHCATDEDHAKDNVSAAQLNSTFQNIAGTITKLRLTQ